MTLKLTVPGLANAFLLLFGCSLADFATPLILAGSDFPVLPTEAYLQITGMFDLKSGAVLSLLLLVPACSYSCCRNGWSPAHLRHASAARASRDIDRRQLSTPVLALGACVPACCVR